jgi:beta-aspartyl-peptidase (threonine type)
VRDSGGDIAAAVSTGGLEGTLAGRVGDTPLPGCGYYADNQIGGVCFSGDGERIARVVLAAKAMQALEAGEDPQRTAERCLRVLARVGGEAGAIILDRHGRLGWAHNSRHFAIAAQKHGEAPMIALRHAKEH